MRPRRSVLPSLRAGTLPAVAVEIVELPPRPGLPNFRKPAHLLRQTGPVGSAATAASKPLPLLFGSRERLSDAPRVEAPAADLRPKRGRALEIEDVPSPVDAVVEASTRAQHFMQDELAVARMRNGLVDPYFEEMRRALARGLGRRLPAAGRDMDAGLQVDSSSEPMEVEAPTQFPSADTLEVEPRRDANFQARERDPLGLTPSGQIGEALGDANDFNRRVAEGRRGARLRVRVEVWQGRNGKVVRLVTHDILAPRPRIPGRELTPASGQ